MRLKFSATTPKELPEIIRKIDTIAQQNALRIWVLDGEMGAGKTTFVKAIGEVFGFVDSVSSPTFSIVNEYANAEEELFYHFDFYRLESQEEALDMGCEEYFDSGNYCFLEWAERIPDLLPSPYLLISIRVEANETRTLNLSIK